MALVRPPRPLPGPGEAGDLGGLEGLHGVTGGAAQPAGRANRSTIAKRAREGGSEEVHLVALMGANIGIWSTSGWNLEHLHLPAEKRAENWTSQPCFAALAIQC